MRVCVCIVCVLRVLSVHHTPAPSGFDLLFIIYTARTFPQFLLFLSKMIVRLCACVLCPFNFNHVETSPVWPGWGCSCQSVHT